MFVLLFYSLNFIYSEDIFFQPLSDHYIIHPGENFCDEMYYHSYRSRKYHTAIDYIKKWKNKPILQGENDLTNLLALYQKNFSNPTIETSSFWNDKVKLKEFLKINLYRDGFDIIDTNLGLYPKSKLDESYGHGDIAYAIYDGYVVDSFDPVEPSGWGKSVLIEHIAPKGKVFEIFWKNKSYRLEKFWSGYFHNESNLVGKNDKVSKGKAICKIGDANGIFNSLHGKNGIKEGSHLHFEIRIQEAPLFPNNNILSNKEKVESIYIDPKYFLENTALVNK